MNLIQSIKQHEGFRAKAYQDTEGVWTIGYGTNLQQLEISPEQAEEWLELKVAKLFEYFDADGPYCSLDSIVRKEVIIEMAYNLGIQGVLNFKKMWTAIKQKDWTWAAEEMLESKWAKQVGKRAVKLAGRMKTGKYE